MKLSTLLSFFTGLLALLLAGCIYIPAPEPPPSRVYLMLVADEGVGTGTLAQRREEVIAYLLDSGLLANRADLVSDPAQADRIIRAILTPDGFKLSIFRSGRDVPASPIYLPSDYGYYDGLIFYGTPGSRYPLRNYDHQPRTIAPAQPTPPPPTTPTQPTKPTIKPHPRDPVPTAQPQKPRTPDQTPHPVTPRKTEPPSKPAPTPRQDYSPTPPPAKQTPRAEPPRHEPPAPTPPKNETPPAKTESTKSDTSRKAAPPPSNDPRTPDAR